MVRVVDVPVAREEVRRITSHHDVRTGLADDPNYIAPQGEIRHQVAVRMIQEVHLVHT